MRKPARATTAGRARHKKTPGIRGRSQSTKVTSAARSNTKAGDLWKAGCKWSCKTEPIHSARKLRQNLTAPAITPIRVPTLSPVTRKTRCNEMTFAASSSSKKSLEQIWKWLPRTISVRFCFGFAQLASLAEVVRTVSNLVSVSKVIRQCPSTPF